MTRLQIHSTQLIQSVFQPHDAGSDLLMSLIHLSPAFCNQLIIFFYLAENVEFILQADMGIVNRPVDFHNLAHIVSALNGRGIERLCVFNIVSQFYPRLRIEISHGRSHSKLGSLCRIELLVGANHHSLGAVARHPQYIAAAIQTYPEVLIAHAAHPRDFGIPHVLLREYGL